MDLRYPFWTVVLENVTFFLFVLKRLSCCEMVPFCLYSIKGETAFKACRSQTIHGNLTEQNLFDSPHRIWSSVQHGDLLSFSLFCAERWEFCKYNSFDESSILITSRTLVLSTFIIILMAKETIYGQKGSKNLVWLSWDKNDFPNFFPNS